MIRKKQDLFLSIFILVFTVIFILFIPSQTVSKPILGASGYEKITGQFFPYITSVIMLAAGVLLLLSALFSKKEEKETETFTLKEFLYVIAVVGGGYVYLFLIGLIGYWISTAVLIAGLMYITHLRNWKIIVIYPIALMVVIYFVFYRAFYIPLS